MSLWVKKLYHARTQILHVSWIHTNTPPKFNVEPENDGFQKGISFSRDFFSGSMLNFRGVFFQTLNVW